MVDHYIPIKCPILNARCNSLRTHPIVAEALLEMFNDGSKKIYCKEYLGNKQCKPSEDYPNISLECFYSKESLPL